MGKQVSGLLFPKQGIKKRKCIKRKESILQENDGRCFLCMLLDDDDRYHSDIECHHVFNGSDRDFSEIEGLTVYLCREHHRTGTAAVHRNHGVDLIVKRYAQAAWEQNHTREEFRKRARKSYL